MFFIHVPCFLMFMVFCVSFVWLHVYAFAMLFMVHCGSAFEPGASGLPYYCTSTCTRSGCTRRASCVDLNPPKKNWVRYHIELAECTCYNCFPNKHDNGVSTIPYLYLCTRLCVYPCEVLPCVVLLSWRVVRDLNTPTRWWFCPSPRPKLTRQTQHGGTPFNAWGCALYRTGVSPEMRTNPWVVDF